MMPRAAHHGHAVRCRTVSLLAALLLLAPAPTRSQSAAGRPTARDSILRHADLLSAEGRFDEVIRTLSHAGDSSAAASYALGAAYAATNDIRNALASLERAVRAAPGQASYRVQYARVLTQAGRIQEAEAHYRTVLGTDSMNVPALVNLATLLSERRSYAEAVPLLTRAVGLQPRNFFLHFQIGSLLVRLGEPDSARSFLSTSLALNRGYLPAQTLLGSLYFNKGSYQEALRVYTTAAQTHEEVSDIFYRMGLCLEKLENRRGAVRAFSRAVELDTANDNYLAHLGQAYYQMGQYDSAIIAYGRAAGVDPDNPTYFINMALAWTQRDSVSQAADQYRAAIRAHHPEAIGRVYDRLANLLFTRKRYREARASYLKALQLNPGDIDARFYLALSLDHLKQLQEAARQYARFLTDVPRTPANQERISAVEARLKALGTGRAGRR